ncbi:hypothetical protein X975_12916, partial [Stegodyphus mimosarum]
MERIVSDEILIATVQNHPVIWDARSMDHRNLNLVQKAWEMIAE